LHRGRQRPTGAAACPDEALTGRVGEFPPDFLSQRGGRFRRTAPAPLLAPADNGQGELFPVEGPATLAFRTSRDRATA